MRRFIMNRWWALILTLAFLLAGSAGMTTPSFGDRSAPRMYGDSGGSDGPVMGDPDGPAGPSGYTPFHGRSQTGGKSTTVTPVGDGGSAWRVWMWRFHVALQSWLGRLGRF